MATTITPPRVPIIDQRTGLISREWYRFFLTLFELTGAGKNLGSIDDLLVAPIAAQNTLIEPDTLSTLTEQVAELKKEIESLKLNRQPELGTFAQLQQANLPWMTFSPSPESVPALTAGTMYWDSADGNKTLNIVMHGGNVTQQVGEEQFFRIKATSAITNGQAVMFTGTVGASGALTGAPATGLTASTASYLMGIATEDIALNGWGYVTSFGLVRKVDTSAFVAGDILYLNPSVAGGLTTTTPTAPNPKIQICAVVYSSASNGSLFVRPSFGGILGQYEGDVNVSSVAAGNLLQRNAANTRWENVTPASVLAGAAIAPVTKSADFTVTDTEQWIINNKTSTCTVTLPAASNYPGRILTFTNYQPQQLISASSDVVLVTGGTVQTSILPATDGAWCTMVSNGSNWRILQQ